MCLSFFFFNDTATTEIYTLSLHDALPISVGDPRHRNLRNSESRRVRAAAPATPSQPLPIASEQRSEEHTSELQSPCNLVCRLLLEKKKNSTPSATATKTSRSSIRDLPIRL